MFTVTLTASTVFPFYSSFCRLQLSYSADLGSFVFAFCGAITMIFSHFSFQCIINILSSLGHLEQDFLFLFFPQVVDVPFTLFFTHFSFHHFHNSIFTISNIVSNVIIAGIPNSMVFVHHPLYLVASLCEHCLAPVG